MQTTAVPQVAVTQPQQISMYDPRTYEGIQWSPQLKSTLRLGIPAWGDGQFSSYTAWLAWLGCFCGFHGMQRVYLGDVTMGIIYCLTGGLCGIGTCIDCCLLNDMVEQLNIEIIDAVRQKAQFLSTTEPQIVAYPVQPQFVQPGFIPPAQGQMVFGQPTYIQPPTAQPVYALPAQGYPANPVPAQHMIPTQPSVPTIPLPKAI
ncbi:uncharacterized protein MONOS_14261 [Monocercomonoides exilis]|uniref:uncharacterized protein n=1 Tax=Monocercomonoides exilis TaxID=2049356 RepID=UPI00355A74FE|nr:hypothetical protein MONOS_14261 [Monocercomonoides exilis]|eukprot:MONOS_14261.1-p1 / transcript=MONOS_14261.1 / gene=MONOS_14261 / organism=Monocercomonoides_exilis_PA203 / gene_product=unspecified product / transcript_product=unspecified product / location=Mono_scaffold00966:10268-10942(-) / protein_length=202 / sequence_SO=supercontig / SO=protein_coding / is_pseudo=false